MLEATLEGHPATLKALLGGDRAEWEELLEHLQAHPDALPSQECVRSLIFEERSLRRWLEVARDAAFEVHVSFASDPATRARLFARWLLRGVAAQLSGLAVHDRAGLEVELGLCRLQEGLGVGDPLAEGRELVERLRRAWGEATHELPRALLLWGRRAAEAGAHDESLAAAMEAELRFARLGPAFAGKLAEAKRLQAEALEHLGPGATPREAR